MASGYTKKQKLIVNFAQGTQRIAKITELAGPNEFVIQPEPEQPAMAVDAQEAELSDSPITDAEIASLHSGEGDAPVAAIRAKRAASAYASVAVTERPTIVVS